MLPPAEAGAPGKDADLDQLRAFVVEQVQATVALQAEPIIRAAVSAEIAALPPAKPGTPGKDADPEAIGAVVMAQARAMITEEIETRRPGHPSAAGRSHADRG